MISEPSQSWPSLTATFSPPCLPSSIVAACSHVLPPSLPPYHPSNVMSFPKWNKKKEKKSINKLIDIENPRHPLQLSHRHHQRHLAPTQCPHAPLPRPPHRELPHHYLPPSPTSLRPSLSMPLTSSATLQDCSSTFSFSTPLSMENPQPASKLSPMIPCLTARSLSTVRPQDPLGELIVTQDLLSCSPSSSSSMELPPLVILGRTFDRVTLGTLIFLIVLVTSIRSLLISGPFLDWFGTCLLPSLTILDRRSAIISGITPFFPLRHHCLIQLLPRHPQPHLTHLNLSRNALSGSEHHRPSLPRCYPPLLHTSDLSPVDHHCLNVIPHQPLASCCVAIISHPGRATTKPPPPLPLSSHETKEGKPPWIDMGKMRKER